MTVPFPRTLAGRVRPHFSAVVQTALAAMAAWSLALAVLPTDQPAFAAIAAVISLGVAHGRRLRRAAELVGGVVLGIGIGSALLWVLGTGPWQIGLLVVLAMTVALLLGAGEMAVTEAAVSAILLAAFAPEGTGFSADRILEGLIGGAVALAVAALVLPPSPARMVGDGAQRLFDRLAGALQEIALALATADPVRAHAALKAAREIDAEVEALEEQLLVASETAALAPARRRDGDVLRRYEQALPQLDFAVRNTRVLARHASRHARGRVQAPAELTDAVARLAEAVAALAAQDPRAERAPEARDLARSAALTATSVRASEPALAEVVAQVRLVAVDLVRAAERLGDAPVAALEEPTEELLAPVRTLATA